MRVAHSWAGSGFKSLLQVGYAQAVEELQLSNLTLQNDFATGTSAGSLIAAFMQSGQVDALEDLFLSIKSSDVYSFNPLKAFGHQASFFDNSPLRKTLLKHLDCAALVKNSKSCIINATDTRNWTTTHFNLEKMGTPDSIVDTLLDSTAIPVAFPSRNGFVDGGVLYDFPLLPLLVDNFDVIVIFVASTSGGGPIKNVISMAEKAISAMLYGQLIADLQALHAADATKKVCLVIPDKPVSVPLLDISSVSKQERQDWIDYGKNLATPILKSLMTNAPVVTSPKSAAYKLSIHSKLFNAG
jgi:predicted acylesterase/phospholipase RssA